MNLGDLQARQLNAQCSPNNAQCLPNAQRLCISMKRKCLWCAAFAWCTMPASQCVAPANFHQFFIFLSLFPNIAPNRDFCSPLDFFTMKWLSTMILLYIPFHLIFSPFKTHFLKVLHDSFKCSVFIFYVWTFSLEIWWTDALMFCFCNGKNWQDDQDQLNSTYYI